MAVAVQRHAVAVAARRSRRRGAPRSPLKLTIANPGAAAFPFGLGWHPFFVRGPDDAHRISRARRLGNRRDAAADAACRRSVRSGASILPGDPGVATIDNVFTGWDGEATLADADRRILVTVRADCAGRLSRRVRARRQGLSCARAGDAHDRRVQSRRARRTRHRHAHASPRRRVFLYDGDRRPPAPMTSPEPLTANALRCVLDIRASLGECPVWSATEDRCSTGSTSTRRRSTASIPRPAATARCRCPTSIGCFALAARTAASSSRCATASGSRAADGTLERKVADAPYDPGASSLQRRTLRSAGAPLRRHDEREARRAVRRALSPRSRLSR